MAKLIFEKNIEINEIKDTPLKLVVAGAVNEADPPVTASQLWQDKPTIVFVIRRPGCAFCREEAYDLCLKYESGEFGDVKMIGIIKEVAGLKPHQVSSDQKLGVQVFQEKYFKNNPVYLDETRSFYKALGNRSLVANSVGTLSFWNPFNWFSFLKFRPRLEAKKIEGNLVGEGLLMGGVFIVMNTSTGSSAEEKTPACIYTYREKTGFEVPIGAMLDAMDGYRVTK